MRNHIEDDNQEALIRWCALNQTKYPELEMIFAIPNGGKRNAREAARLKRCGVKVGVPDLFLPIPSTTKCDHPSGCFSGLFIEMKAGKNGLSEKQAHFKGKLILIGYQYFVCYSWTDAVNEICEYLGIPERV